jgi:uncharacterized C2H2 Zn-finger protein
MTYTIRETKGRFYNAYGQRISRSVAEMLRDCNRAEMVVIEREKDYARHQAMALMAKTGIVNP